MNSPKQTTQRRMLNSRNTSNSPRFAKLAGRSPNNKQLKKKTQTRTTLGSQQSLENAELIKSLKNIQQVKEKIPQRVIQNIEQDVIQFDNRDRFEGGVNKGKMFGKGTYYFYQQNLKYVGQFFDNQFHGWGVIMKNYGNQSPIYEGSFQHGKKHGEGKYEYGPNHYYNGNWAFDKKQGKGVYHYQDGLYNGEWSKNSKHGEGSLKLNDGTQYKGAFQNDQFVRGLVRYPNGDQYSGQVFNGKRQGEGSYFHFQSQQRYKGQWKNNRKNGRGIVYLRNGDEFHCTFVNGQIDQTQSCTYKWSSGEDSGSIFNGWFKNNVPEKGHVTRSNGEQYDTY